MPKRKKSTTTKAKPKSVESTPKKYKVGDEVEAQADDGKFYDATVTSIEGGSYKVSFDGTDDVATVKELKERSEQKTVTKSVGRKKGIQKSSPQVKASPSQRVTRSTQSSPSKLAPDHSPSVKSLKAKATKETKSAKSTPKTSPKTSKTSPKTTNSSPKSPKASPKVSLSKQFKLAEKQEVSSSPKRGRGQAKPGLPARKKGKAEHKWNIGDIVEALWDDGRMYAARIEKVNQVKNGAYTYDVRFTEDKVLVKGKKSSQIQSPEDDDDEEESSSSEEEEKTTSRSSSPTKRKRVEDEEYVEGESESKRDDYFLEPTGSAEEEEEDSDFEKKGKKRKRPASPKKQPTVSKKRRENVELKIQALRKPDLVKVILEAAEKKPTMYVDLEKVLKKREK